MMALSISCPRLCSPFGHQASERLLQQQLHLWDEAGREYDRHASCFKGRTINGSEWSDLFREERVHVPQTQPQKAIREITAVLSS